MGEISGIAIGAAIGIVLLVIILLLVVKLIKKRKIKILVTARHQENIQGLGMCYNFFVNDITILILLRRHR